MNTKFKEITEPLTEVVAQYENNIRNTFGKDEIKLTVNTEYLKHGYIIKLVINHYMDLLTGTCVTELDGELEQQIIKTMREVGEDLGILAAYEIKINTYLK